MEPDRKYPLGDSDAEAQRLAIQAAQVETLTEVVFRRAGLTAGMRVLDIGSGAGDVAFLAARIVGSAGAVLGIERSPAFVETASARAAELGLAQVRFAQADITAFATDETFDAIVGRFVLSYLPDRVAVLQRLMRHLRPGGIVAFQELDMTQIAQSPPSALFTQVRQWVLDAFAAGGTELAMGGRLHATLRAAGLSDPQIAEVSPVEGWHDCGGYEGLVCVLHSLLPTLERHGIATVAEIGLDTLAQRLRADAEAHRRWLSLSRIVGAWASSPISSSPDLGY